MKTYWLTGSKTSTERLRRLHLSCDNSSEAGRIYFDAEVRETLKMAHSTVIANRIAQGIKEYAKERAWRTFSDHHQYRFNCLEYATAEHRKRVRHYVDDFCREVGPVLAHAFHRQMLDFIRSLDGRVYGLDLVSMIYHGKLCLSDSETSMSKYLRWQGARSVLGGEHPDHWNNLRKLVADIRFDFLSVHGLGLTTECYFDRPEKWVEDAIGERVHVPMESDMWIPRDMTEREGEDQP